STKESGPGDSNVTPWGRPMKAKRIAIYDGTDLDQEHQTERHTTMNTNRLTRRTFLNTSAATAGWLAAPSGQGQAAQAKAVTIAALDRILAAPILKTDFVKEPVVVASVELLRNGKTYLLRTRSAAGVEAVTVPNPARMAESYPLFLQHILPVFVKKD